MWSAGMTYVYVFDAPGFTSVKMESPGVWPEMCSPCVCRFVVLGVRNVFIATSSAFATSASVFTSVTASVSPATYSPTKPSGASTVLRAGRRGWAEFRQNCLAILKLVTVLTSCLVAFANVYAIARARSPRLALVDDVRLGCASAFALLVVCVEGESRVVLRELALLERSFLAKGLLLAYIGVTTWDEDAGLVELGNIAAMLCWACGGAYALLGACCCGGAAAGAPKGEVYEAMMFVVRQRRKNHKASWKKYGRPLDLIYQSPISSVPLGPDPATIGQ